MSIVLAADREIYLFVPNIIRQSTDETIYFIKNREELNVAILEEIKPRYIFFLHWSSIIPAEIYENFECVVFHMTDLPYGRGGSPLQNLIAREIFETKLTAFRCEAGLDTGPVYLKHPLCLRGTAEEIFIRTAKEMVEMIKKILIDSPPAIPQEGSVEVFSRRTPAESDITNIKTLNQLFCHIQMLDAASYPHAFLETENFRLEFRRASLLRDEILCDVRIKEK